VGSVLTSERRFSVRRNRLHRWFDSKLSKVCFIFFTNSAYYMICSFIFRAYFTTFALDTHFSFSFLISHFFPPFFFCLPISYILDLMFWNFMFYFLVA
jgi:hypothetical protein